MWAREGSPVVSWSLNTVFKGGCFADSLMISYPFLAHSVLQAIISQNAHLWSTEVWEMIEENASGKSTLLTDQVVWVQTSTNSILQRSTEHFLYPGHCV